MTACRRRSSVTRAQSGRHALPSPHGAVSDERRAKEPGAARYQQHASPLTRALCRDLAVVEELL